MHMLGKNFRRGLGRSWAHVVLALAGLAPVHAAAPRIFTLVEGGTPNCAIILSDDASPIEKHAAEELRGFLRKVTGADVPQQSSARPGVYCLWLGTPATCMRIRAAGALDEVGGLDDEGFVLRADEQGLLIAGKKPIGVLYGVYAFLEKQVGLRWFFPGPDGEYCPKQATIRIPALDVAQNPAFTTRSLTLTCIHPAGPFDDVWDWMARNKMQITGIKHPYATEHLDQYFKRGAFFRGGGHVLPRFVPESLFEAHPEYFPLIKGKRTLLDPDPQTRNQPCTTHPDVADRAVQYILDYFRREPEGGVFLLGNNDGQGWCECEKCVTLDPPWEREKGFVSTRFYTFINDVARRVYQEYPDGKIWGWGYQNFQHPPTGIRPDPRLTVLFCMHGRCYRHSLGDEACAANGKHRDYIAGWAKFGNEVMSREYYSCFVDNRSLPDAIVYLPLERLVAEDIRYLHRVGVRGWVDEVPPMNADFSGRFDRRPITESWRARFSLYYVAAKLLWDPELDVDALLAEMHAKLYGPAAPAMAKYRALLTECWHETPGHCIYGFPYVAVGRSLARPGAEEKLKSFLDQAEAAAAGDSAVLARVRLDRDYFDLAWKRAHRQFQAMATGDIHAQKREDAIVVDGILDEPGWKTAEYVASFIKKGTERAEHQTYVRLLYDANDLYLAIEAEEPQTDQLRVDCRTRDSKVWSNDSIELFIDPAGTGERYYHIAVNPFGALYDAECKAGSPFNARFNADCEAAAAVLDDRWLVELRLRAASIGAAIQDMGQWKMNVARTRRAGDTREPSSWFDGTYHQPASFRTVVFGTEGIIQNGGFEDIMTLDTERLLERYDRPGWHHGNSPPRLPRRWFLHGGHPGTATVVTDGVHSGQRAWKIEDGWVQQSMASRFAPNGKLRIQFWARGEGRLTVAIYQYEQKADGNWSFDKTKVVGTDDLGAAWQRHDFGYTHGPDDPPKASLAFWIEGQAILDDVFVTTGQ